MLENQPVPLLFWVRHFHISEHVAQHLLAPIRRVLPTVRVVLHAGVQTFVVVERWLLELLIRLVVALEILLLRV